ncbi:uncharacterized protein C9orf85 homolog [Mauremys mutica]|uniref:Uncharacterized protein n=1 Tax=Mauremys mutica TaxID=74926 RepID=A0A9D3WXA5_9SAUR|nr:uncharacterized protein C9orf85 homolog [Mauremys mutica]KAH1169058.1 hypothetical protein KIL84_013648 [Mauremys mutica]
MSSQRGNVARSRPQRHQNSRVFKNDKYDKSAQRKKINAKLHDGVCQRCKEVLEWRVKFSKYKPLSKPKKCVKCLQKTVKDSYHIICRSCACELEVCAKCGKKEEIVLISKGPEKMENETTGNCQRKISRREESEESDELDFDIDLDGMDEKNPDMLEEHFKNMKFERTEV